jgi:hypothetical protein
MLAAFLRRGEHGSPTRRLALVLTLAAVGVAASAPPALAKFTRPFRCQITSSATPSPTECNGTGNDVPGGTFGRLQKLALNATGDVYVVDSEQKAIDEFDPSGAFLSQIVPEGAFDPTELRGFAIDNDPSSSHFGYLYVLQHEPSGERAVVDVFNPEGELSAQWSGPEFYADDIAVDSSADPSDPYAGDVYLSAVRSSSVTLVNPSGEPVFFTTHAPYISGNQIIGSEFASVNSTTLFSNDFDAPAGIATDSHGDLFVADPAIPTSAGEGAVEEFAPGGRFLRAVTGSNVPGGLGVVGGAFATDRFGLAVDPTNDHLLVASNVENEGPANFGLIDEFDSTGHYLNQITGISPGARFVGPHGLAVNADGTLYVADLADVDVFEPGAFDPDVEVAAATERHPTAVTLQGSVNPEGLPLGECRFQYVTEGAFEVTGFSDLASGGEAPCAPSAAEIPIDSASHPVHAGISGLVSGITYRYRLLATSNGEHGGAGTSPSLPFTAPDSPRVDSTFADNLSSTFADLNATIDPLGAVTSYRFQYVGAAHYEPAAADPYAAGISVPVSPVAIGSGGAAGTADAVVLQDLGGLAAATTYHFRVVAGNDVGETPGPDQTFTTLPEVVPGLPDHRAYELLTPPDKGSAEDMFGGQRSFDVGYSSEDGNHFLLDTGAAFGPFPASGENSYAFSRGPDGWTYASSASPGLGLQSAPAVLYDPVDFSQLGVEDHLGSIGNKAAQQNVDLLGPPGGPYATINSSLGGAADVEMIGGSADLSHMILASKDHQLAAGDASQDAESNALYEYSAGRLSLINVDGEGALLSRCGAILGLNIGAGDTHSAVSTDGSRVFFTAPDPNGSGAGCWDGAQSNPPQLYLRLRGETTVEVSAPEAGAPEAVPHHPAVFVGASSDGSRVFFMSASELTHDDEGIHDVELYEYDTETSTLTRVSRGESGDADGNVFDVPAVSADGSAVYFNAAGRLAAGAPAVSGEEVNLYRFDTETDATTYIATVSTDDYPNTTTNHWYKFGTAGLDPQANWFTSANGRYLAFASTRDLTGYDTTAASPQDCPDLNSVASSGHCDEVYRYDSAAAPGEGLTCVSCNPSGALPTSNALFARSPLSALNPAGTPPRPISNDGAYVFFDTEDALVPQDGNGRLDVYEWHQGRTSMISSGQDFAASFFLDSSPDGANVFFGTHARLVPADTDTAGDLYDARICTDADPCIAPPPSHEGLCEGDACQTIVPAPSDATPGSLNALGPGNVHESQPPPKCRKSKLRSHGKCASKKGKKSRRKHHGTTHKRAANTNRRASR